MRHQLEDAWEVVDATRGARSPVVLSCEHASNRLPDGWSWPEADRWVVELHWAWDIGAAEITRRLARELGAVGVLSRFSRLLCDPNRDVGSPTLIRDIADGKPVQLNQHLTPNEVARRIERLYHPFHEALHREVEQHPGARVLSIHSFTPVYEGGPLRPMELGVLFDRQEAEAERLGAALAARGLAVALNEPYSGRHGLMHSVQTVGDRFGRDVLELEVRQDVAGDPARQDEIATKVASALKEIGWA